MIAKDPVTARLDCVVANIIAAHVTAIIEESDTIFVMYNETKKIATGPIQCSRTLCVTKMEIPSKNPTAVDTAFPPLKFANIGKQCPNVAKKPA